MKTTVSCYWYAAPFYLFFLSLCLSGAVQAQRALGPAPDAGSFNNRLPAAPLLFTENKGQVADKAGVARPDILFTAHSAGAKIYLTATGIHYQFERTILPEGYEPDERKVKDREKQEALRRQVKMQTSRFTLSLKDANPAPRIRKEAQNAYTENFYLANCAITGVHTYERIVYENVYPGIDWIIYSKAKGMEYDFIVHPGANPNLIKLDVKDAKQVSIAADGGLVMTTELGEVKEAAPVSYCGNTEIATAFNQEADGTIGFAVDTWNKSKELRIDPSVTWATYYGGNENDYGYSCAIDASGNVYMSGDAASTAGIASGGFQNTFNSNVNNTKDAFLVKFSSSGARLWATYYGGEDVDYGYSCAVDASGNVYLTGDTKSTSGIASGGFQNAGGVNSDAYLVKFSSAGNRLWATYYGGGGSADFGRCCAVDASGNVYLAGNTSSTSDIASGGFQNTYGDSSDAYLVKFSSSGNRLWATYYGGNKVDEGNSCTVDAFGNVYLIGITFSTFGIASGGFQNTLSGSYDSYLVKFSSNGGRLWATYYGGNGYSFGTSCAVDGSGNVYLAGFTSSTSGIASTGFQNTYSGGSSDAYLVKFSSSGSRLWATYYGGNSDDYGYSCAVDASGNVYLTGWTQSTSGIASGGFQNTYAGAIHAFLVKFSSNGSRLWGTYFGSNGGNFGSFCAVDSGGNLFLAGYTYAASGIAYGGFQNTIGGIFDAFLAKIDGSFVNTSFTSISNGNWNNPATWSGGGTPSIGSVVTINTAVTITANTSCYSIRVNPSGSVTVSPGINLTVLH